MVSSHGAESQSNGKGLPELSWKSLESEEADAAATWLESEAVLQHELGWARCKHVQAVCTDLSASNSSDKSMHGNSRVTNNGKFLKRLWQPVEES